MVTLDKITSYIIELKSFCTFIRGDVVPHELLKGLYLKEAIVNSQPLFFRCL